MSKITGFQETTPDPEAQQGRRVIYYPELEAGSYSFATSSGGMLNKLRPMVDRKLKSSQNHDAHKCPRCESTDTKFCYYNNYNLSQPRYFCKTCRRYWTQGATILGSSRKKKKISSEKSNIPSHVDTNYLYPPANISHRNNTNSDEINKREMDVKRKVVDDDIKQNSDQVLRESMREPVILDKVCEMVLATSSQGFWSRMSNHPLKNHIAHCRMLNQDIGVHMEQIPKEANKCATLMASLGHSQSANHVRVLIPPDEVVEQLMADLVITDHPRLARHSQGNARNRAGLDNSDDGKEGDDEDSDQDHDADEDDQTSRYTY